MGTRRACFGRKCLDIRSGLCDSRTRCPDPRQRFVLIACRLVMGLGLGAEIVIGYSTMAEFVPPQLRGRWIGYLAVITNTAVAVSALVGYFAIPTIGWRTMFALAGLGALIVWRARKSM